MRERLNAKPNDVISKYIFRPAIIDDSKRSFANMMKVNMAHVLMLHKKNLLSTQDAKVLLNALMKLSDKGPDILELNPEYEDLYFNIEEYIMHETGPDIGGIMHTARSRNDLNSTVIRMNVRESIINIFILFLNVKESLIKVAEENVSTVMTGYTHMQPAQPITFAHYLIGIIEALQRDFQRLMNAYNSLNISPLGGAAFAGTSFDIDRSYTRDILGFDGLVENSLDAVASRDYLMEIMSGMAICGTTISRLANDLYIWTSDEFRYIEVDNSMAACSSIMPQKKNPIALEHIKAKTSHLLSSFVSIFCCLKNVLYSHCRDISSEAPREFWDGVEQFEIILELLNETINHLSVNKENMKTKVNKNFSTVTELADELVRKDKITFRKAHGIVGSLVSDCIDLGISAEQITYEMLVEKSREFGIEKLSITDQTVRFILNAGNAINKKNSIGGPAPEECSRMLAKEKEKLKKDWGKYDNIVEKLVLADKNLINDVDIIMKG
ncbi:argininosuccinate lyase [Petroclostridium sp. X23]|uniref:argininosuccinate lyase n=1 Tax=Petroclostridium sp. X23 TaxID=3045146 RepID=UPI0024AD49FF|nr:argininosuccinate lyase [Petroclostridium sp. X23]WHH58224.1 argininosuccinate lyase [Petroclostridium sp. X23]